MPRHWLKHVIILVFCLLPTICGAYDRTTERSAFLAALSDLQRGKQQQFIAITEQLRDYPLYPYLIYADLDLHLPQATPDQIQGFLHTYADTPLADHLRELWLIQLASQNQWQQYLAVYQPTKNLELQCLQREALWQTGQTQAAVNDLATLLGKNQAVPKACLTVFAHALASGDLANTILWQRIANAMQNNNLLLAAQFAALLPDNEKALYQLWQNVYQKPQLILQPGLFNTTQNLTQEILTTAIQHIADHNPRLAIEVWNRLRGQYNFNWQIQESVMKAIALSLAESHDPLASAWLMAIDAKFVDSNVQEWRIRSALYIQDWVAVEKAIMLLPPDQRQLSAWRYWLARSLAAQGQSVAAQNIYRDLSLHGDFYGQLSSLQLDEQPLFAIKTLAVNPNQIAALNSLPTMQRAYELYQLHWYPEAHQEWQWGIQHLPEEDYLAAAELALSWGWFERAIATVNLIDDGSDIALRFPLAYRPEILDVAMNEKLNPAWVFALIRQESLFTPDAKSSAGAIGLMQLLPSTAELIAQKFHLPFSTADLIDANTNLNLGSIYLKRMTMLFNNNILLATAAYNAGPGRVAKWIPASPIPADIWVETIPWHETRDYVKNITASTTFYEKELGYPVTLVQRMQPI